MAFLESDVTFLLKEIVIPRAQILKLRIPWMTFETYFVIWRVHRHFCRVYIYAGMAEFEAWEKKEESSGGAIIFRDLASM